MEAPEAQRELLGRSQESDVTFVVFVMLRRISKTKVLDAGEATGLANTGPACYTFSL